nr:unnamed protein product [Callosobruchus analis]
MDVCDCSSVTCPGCFFPCERCKSQKCGPVCRNGRTYCYEFVEAEPRSRWPL